MKIAYVDGDDVGVTIFFFAALLVVLYSSLLPDNFVSCYSLSALSTRAQCFCGISSSLSVSFS